MVSSACAKVVTARRAAAEKFKYLKREGIVKQYLEVI
jgi:hypothetical protein